MKILHVNTHVNIGGIGNYILTLSTALQSARTEVIVASSGGNLEPEFEKREIKHIRIGLDTKFELHPKVFMAAFALKDIIKNEDIDLIHAHTRVSQVAAYIASRLTGVPYITTCHGYFRTRTRRVFDTWGSRVIAISDAVRDHLIKDLGVDRRRIRLVYSGVDADRFAAVADSPGAGLGKESLGLGPGPVVGNIGRLSPVKGQKVLLRAMASVMHENKTVQLLVVGNGPDERALKALAMALGIEERTSFFDADPETAKYLMLMDVFVFPSIKEGLGIGLLEALASGRACIASRIGGIENIIKDRESGILIDPGDPQLLAKAISNLINDPKARESMGVKGHQLVLDRFSLERMAAEVNAVYEETIRR